MRVFTAVLFLATACAKQDDPARAVPVEKDRIPTPPDAAAPPKPRFDDVKVTVAGKAYVPTRALVKRLPAGEYQFDLANHETTCRQLLDNLFDGGHDNEDILLNTAIRLAPDGKRSTVVKDVYPPHGPGSVNPGSQASPTGSADAGEVMRLAVDLTGKTMAGEPFEVHGAFVANGCGSQREDDSGVPKALHPSSATVTVAGQSFPLVGAIRTDREIRLSTGPQDCSRWTPRAEIRLRTRDGGWRMEGDWLDHEFTNAISPDEKMAKVKVAPGAKGTSADGPTVQLTLSGAGVIEGYPVALSGTIEALDCPPEK
jgi:hypothetical protein